MFNLETLIPIEELQDARFDPHKLNTMVDTTDKPSAKADIKNDNKFQLIEYNRSKVHIKIINSIALK